MSMGKDGFEQLPDRFAELSYPIRYGKQMTRKCSICGIEERTEAHHIISQGRIRKMSRPSLLAFARRIGYSEDMETEELKDLLINNTPSNIIELCRLCHGHTTASVHYRFKKREESRGDKQRGIDEFIDGNDSGNGPE